jgi:hypothetical protein
MPVYRYKDARRRLQGKRRASERCEKETDGEDTG